MTVLKPFFYQSIFSVCKHELQRVVKVEEQSSVIEKKQGGTALSQIN